ncbi:MAG: hypothetical protein AAF518_18220, partial [Spirochaetota bacterium]
MEELKAERIVTLPLGDSLQFIDAPLVNKSYANLPLQIPVLINRLYIPDYKNSLVKVFNRSGALQYVIGTPDRGVDKKVKVLYHKFSSIGSIAITNDENLYVQTLLSSKEVKQQVKQELFRKKSGEFQISQIDIAPSYILQINKKGDIESIIGFEGANTRPFRYIENLYVSQQQRLFVYHRYAARMLLSYYEKGVLKGTINEAEL